MEKESQGFQLKYHNKIIQVRNQYMGISRLKEDYSSRPFINVSVTYLMLI